MSPPRPSILHVAQPTEYGVARCVADLAAAQVAKGWDVTVACPDDGWLGGAVTAAGARHHPWPAVRSPVRALPAERRALRGAVKTPPAVVHLHSAKAGLSGRALLRGGVPTLFQPHAWSFQALDGPARAAAAGWERWAARWTDAFVCCSADEQRLGAEAHITGRFEVVPNAVDLTRFPRPSADGRAAARVMLGVAADVPLVVCAARLSRQKGQDLLVDGWPAIRRAVPEATLALVGDGPEAAGLRRRAGEGVRFVGEVDEVRPWLLAADVVALPSRYEGMALGVLEAMACGRSVVASAADGMREAIGEGAEAAGAVVEAESVEALAAAIVHRLERPEVRELEGRCGRLRIEGHHDRARWSERLCALAEEVARR